MLLGCLEAAQIIKSVCVAGAGLVCLFFVVFFVLFFVGGLVFSE